MLCGTVCGSGELFAANNCGKIDGSPLIERPSKESKRQMFAPGAKVRDLYDYSETHVIVRKTKAQRAADARYFGGMEKGDQWFRVRSDASGNVVCMHRDMLAARND